MKFIADLHIHSPYSRATSKESNLFGLTGWSRIKGIHVVGTGDFTHPEWFRQIKENLTEAEAGFFKLKNPKNAPSPAGFNPEHIPTRFVLTSEISSIYKRHGRVRKVHNVLFVPDLKSAQKISSKLAAIGNIESDGRPILGLDSRDLLEILLENAPEGFLVPAHIWTPWFSLFGSKSGFDRIEDCYGDLTEHIFALETGLSSDPEMNRMVSALDRYTLISNSDCHSPSKLGREVNLFDCAFDYFSMRDALKNPGNGGFSGTLEFFPEEGKYHYDGHRKCGICFDPFETHQKDDICPVCGKPLTIGVSHRVMELADRDKPHYPGGEPGFQSIVPLPEVLGEMLSVGPASKTVLRQYQKVIDAFGSEFNLYLNTPLEDITSFSALLGEAISRIRENKVQKKPGFDGEFGKISVFADGELASAVGQASLFAQSPAPQKSPSARKRQQMTIPKATAPAPPSLFSAGALQLTAAQDAAVYCPVGKVVVTAGPGTGKTFTLIERIAWLMTDSANQKANTVIITFTNKAAAELRRRLTQKNIADTNLFIGTFHSYCLEQLRNHLPELSVVGQEERQLILSTLFQNKSSKEQQLLSDNIEEDLINWQGDIVQVFHLETEHYLEHLENSHKIDLDAVVPLFLKKFHSDAAFHNQITTGVDHLLVDEFQDVNKGQYAFVNELGHHCSTFVIGDPDQSIYGFRGSNPSYFIRMAEAAEENNTAVQAFTLTHNFRSTPTILQAAAAVIAHNPGRHCPLTPTRSAGGGITCYVAPTEKMEAEFIVKSIEEYLGGISHFSQNSGRGGSRDTEKSFSDIAILCRLSSQARPIIEALSRRGIPYQHVGTQPYFRQGALRIIYSFIVSASRNRTNAELALLLRAWPGIKKSQAKKIDHLALQNGNLLEHLQTASLPPECREQINRAKVQLQSFAQKTQLHDIASLLPEIFKIFSVRADLPESQRFLALTTLFGKDLEAFAEHLRENARTTVYDERAEAVAVLTAHAAKGLEFPLVIVAGLEDGLFPHTPENKQVSIEEERRLFYVALTRAKKKLLLTSAASRMLYGKLKENRPSRFIDEIPPVLITKINPPARKQKKKIQQLSLF